MSLFISLRSELIKLKRTASILVCIIAAAFPPFMRFLEDVEEGASRKKVAPWIEHFVEQQDVINIAFLPIYIILVSTLWLQVEYRDKTWKQLLTSPQKMINIFLSKFIILHLLILLFLVLYNVFMAFAGVGTEMIHPNIYNGGFEFGKLLVANAKSYFLSAGISAIQFWLALRFKNFIAPVAIGFVLWIIAPIMIFEMNWGNAEVYPYSYSILGIHPKYKANVVTYQWYSVAYALFFLSIAFIEFKIRKVKS